MIYIDPPYNTGHDFIYKDKFRMDEEDYDAQTELFDEEGNKQFAENSDSNPRFHSDWCSMMYPRLLLARNLLTDDGVIFISIDDNEVANLRKICDEIFGENNFQALITYVRKTSGKQDSSNFMKSTEFILVYSHSNKWQCQPVIASEHVLNRYNKEDKSGQKYRETDLRKTGNADRRTDRPLMFYPFYYNPQTQDLLAEPIENPKLENDGYIKILPIKPDGTEGRWRWGLDNARSHLDFLVARLMPKYKSQNKYTIYERDFINKKGNIRTIKEHTSWDRKEFNSDNAIAELKKMGFSNQLFPFPKSSALIKHMCYLADTQNSIILDFFSGSATTAHAVMQLNAEDGGHRKFIMVQLPEACDAKSEAYKAGYRTICDIGEERIRRAGEKIRQEHPDAGLDTGFRVFRVDSTNMEDVYYSAGDYAQEALAGLTSNIKPDRSALDVFFGCVLDWGLPLDRPYETEEIAGYAVHNYDHGALLACFADAVSEELVRAMAQRRPLRAVFRDSSFPDSPAKINAEEIFKMYSPLTKIKVI